MWPPSRLSSMRPFTSTSSAGAEQNVVRVGGVNPTRAAITIIRRDQCAAAVARTVETAAGGRIQPIRRRRVHVDGVQIGVNQRGGRALQVRVTIAAGRQLPGLGRIVRAQHAAHLHRGIDALPMKGEPAHTAGLGRIGQKPMMLVAQLSHLGALAPTGGPVARDKNASRLGAGHFEIRNLRMIGQPAHVALAEAGIGRAPALAQVIRAPHPVARRRPGSPLRAR